MHDNSILIWASPATNHLKVTHRRSAGAATSLGNEDFLTKNLSNVNGDSNS